jgi:tetratricopeptide (TPR) repeat protein
MDDNVATYNLLMLVDNLTNLSNEASLEHIGILIDLSLDLKKREGTERAIRLLEELQKRQLTAGQLATLNYFMANAWASLRTFSRANTDRSWDWEQEEAEKEIIHLRRALHNDGIRELPDQRLCEILTNLGNLMDYVGRFVEAIEYWDRALTKIPSFSMARGNRGYGLTHYARTLYDKGHSAVFLKYAHTDLKTALLSSELYEGAKIAFDKCRTEIESVLSPDYINKDIDMYNFSLGTSKQEIKYRRWCLEKRLFLNPLNDLGPYPIAARDIFTTPNIVVGVGEGPYYPGYFNQMKQEFVSARYLYYDGINTKRPHFSDRDVLLYNTLDYPSYSLDVEKVKVAFRMVYSLFDKIAYFLNHYLGLSIPETKVKFRTFWYASKNRKNGLRQDLQQLQNWPLRGLFWLSKDLYENESGFKESIEPDAQELSEIRNHLEHKYLKLHENFWPGPSLNNDETSQALVDTLAFSTYRKEFEEKTLRLIKMARAALIYLSLAVHTEEKKRAKERNPEKIIPGMPLDAWEDEWKV